MSPLTRCTTAFSASTTSVPWVRWTLPVNEQGPSPATVQSVVTAWTSRSWLRSDVRANAPAHASAAHRPRASMVAWRKSAGLLGIVHLDVRHEPDALAVEQGLHAVAAQYRTGLRHRDRGGRGGAVRVREHVQLLGCERDGLLALARGLRGHRAGQA